MKRAIERFRGVEQIVTSDDAANGAGGGVDDAQMAKTETSEEDVRVSRARVGGDGGGRATDTPDSFSAGDGDVYTIHY